jgi:hypothetical protein
VKEAELQEALEPVREYFSGREVRVNTVLAAHLRSHGLPASGRPWERAKAVMRSGAAFDEAVAAAVETDPAEIGYAIPGASGRTTASPGAAMLDWYPKQFGPGDMDGIGARRLLGTPNNDIAWVLVREMGQNSWDARGAAPAIDFALNLRRLDASTLEVLRERILTGEAPGTGLPGLLERDEVWALEVSDHGTVGLTGPVRNDRAVDPGEDTNFIDLILNMGAPRDVHLGGGTYGFGKTIAYVTSSVGTVLVWSHCEGPNGLEHRLIGTAIGDAFDLDGGRFTGRHWWGVTVPDEGRVEPVVGEPARRLAEQVFSTRYTDSSTGTSILILDPRLGGSTREEDSRRIAEAVVWNLWPKLLADQAARSRMRIAVQFDGRQVPLPTVESHPVIAGHARCLLAVRAAQEPDRSELEQPITVLGLPVQVHEIWCKLPMTLLGHLALIRYPVPRGAESPSHSITLMRHQAELVVRLIERRELDVEGFQWAGVFKPVADVDDSFAMAEPPAHDDWVPTAVVDKARRRHVTVALKRIRDTADEWLLPRPHDRSGLDDMTSVAHIGDMLAGLVSGLEGPGPTTRAVVGIQGQMLTRPEVADVEPPAAKGRSGSRNGGRRAARPRVELVGTTQVPAADVGWTRTTVDVQLSDAAAAGASVDVSVKVGIDGGSLDDTSAVRILGWHDEHGEGFRSEPQRLVSGGVRQFTFEARSDLAIDIQTWLVNH